MRELASSDDPHLMFCPTLSSADGGVLSLGCDISLIAVPFSLDDVGGTAPLLFQAAKAADRPNAFIVYVTVIIGVSLLVYIFWLKNKAMTALDREQGSAWEVPASSAAR